MGHESQIELWTPPKCRSALLVSEPTGFEYCVSAHTAIGKFAGLTDQQILNSRQGQGTSPKDTAALTFARELLEKRGQVPANSIRALRDMPRGGNQHQRRGLC
jgi:hypothetical protein